MKSIVRGTQGTIGGGGLPVRTGASRLPRAPTCRARPSHNPSATARAALPLLGPPQPRFPKSHTPGTCETLGSLIGTDQLKCPGNIRATQQASSWSPAPTAPKFITEHRVRALSGTGFSGLHGFPRRDNKCVQERGVIY